MNKPETLKAALASVSEEIERAKLYRALGLPVCVNIASDEGFERHIMRLRLVKLAMEREGRRRWYDVLTVPSAFGWGFCVALWLAIIWNHL